MKKPLVNPLHKAGVANKQISLDAERPAIHFDGDRRNEKYNFDRVKYDLVTMLCVVTHNLDALRQFCNSL